MPNRIIFTLICLLFFVIYAVPVYAAMDNTGDDIGERVREPVRESVEIRKQTQKEDEAWQNEKERLIAHYDRLREENARLEKDEAALENDIAATGQRIKKKETELAGIAQLTEGIDPFLHEMMIRIETLVEEGMPFLQKERAQRVERLNEMMADPDMQISEKFRRIMEALLVEAEYGNTIEVYQETIDVSGRFMLVNIFRLGRINLFYQSMDQQQNGYFDIAANQWKTLPKTYNRAISSAIDIGAKRQPVEILNLPLGRMVIK